MDSRPQIKNFSDKELTRKLSGLAGFGITGKGEPAAGKGIPPALPQNGTTQYHSSVASNTSKGTGIHGRIDWSSK